MILTLIYFSLLGLITGSFLNVIILRYNTDVSLGGRSGCFSCGQRLQWFEMVPVLSFLFLRGRCLSCQSKISRQYPLVELFTGILFALSAWKFYPDFFTIIFYCILLSLLMIVIVYDLRHKIIADGPVYAFILLSLFTPVVRNTGSLTVQNTGWEILVKLISGFIIFLFFFSLWYFSGGRWMGFGDAKLGFGMGTLLGLSGAVNAVVLAFWLGAVVGLTLIAFSKIKLKKFKSFRRRFSIKSEIPFAPFLVLGLVLNLFWNIIIFVF